MKKVKGMPITGATPQYSKKKPFVPDAKDTSADAQTMIQEAPTPFKNRNTTPNIPAATGASGNVSTMEPRIASGLQHSSPGVKALPEGGAIGQNKMPNQSPQIGGRMGFPPPRRKAGMNGQGFPSKRNAKFYGE
jgi:hypothetical protein